MLGRALWDRVTVIYTGLVNSSPLTQVALIEGIEHSFKADPGEWRTTFRLSPADTTPYFVLNDTTYGTLAGSVASGNSLAY